MAELSKIFPNVEEYETYVNGGNLPSNVLAVILNEDKTDVAQISFSTNNITGSFETFTCVGDQAYSELQDAYNEKVAELGEANETIQTQASQIQDLEGQVDVWHDRYDTLYNQYGNLQDEYRQALNEIGHMEDLLDQRDETIATLNSQVQTLTQQLSTANATITSLQNDITSYDNQLKQI